jgi:hypothetical protein
MLRFFIQDWHYDYYCRIEELADFPMINGSMLMWDDPILLTFNDSCLDTITGSSVDLDRCS